MLFPQPSFIKVRHCGVINRIPDGPILVAKGATMPKVTQELINSVPVKAISFVWTNALLNLVLSMLNVYAIAVSKPFQPSDGFLRTLFMRPVSKGRNDSNCIGLQKILTVDRIAS